MDANKLESIISGYGINADDAAWLRALSRPIPAAANAPPPDAAYLVVHIDSGYVAGIASYAEEPVGRDHRVVRYVPEAGKGEVTWQPIEDAPDGVTVLTWHNYGCIVANPEHPAFGRTGMMKRQKKFMNLWPSEITETGRVTHWATITNNEDEKATDGD